MENMYQQERYVRAQRKVKEIKGFYIHILITLLIIPGLIFVNLRFVPEYHWFWFPVIGMSLGVLIHWLSVFGFSKMGIGRAWEERKIRELMNEDKH